MKKLSFLFLLFLTLSTAFTSCKDKEAETTEVTDAAPAGADATASGLTPTTPPAGAEATATPVPTGPTTSISFENPTYDWGKVNDGDKVTHVFKFTNTGENPLIISDAKGSCGCTVPEWPKEPIAPGKKGEIKVVFDSKGKGSKEGKMDSKKVTITANTDPVNTYLTIQGMIVNPNAQ
jgi:hypothetical protein